VLAGIDTTRLRVFREVARQGSFTAAALALQVSQPAVSQHIARLEQELGCALLERSSRRVRPTPAGEAFLRHVESLLTGLAEARRELAALANSDTGPLRLAAFPSAAATFVPAAVGALRARYPGVCVRMTEADPPQAIAPLIAGDVDLAVCYDYPTVGALPDPRLRLTTLAVDRMAVAVPADGELAGAAGPVPFAALAGEQWVAPGPSVCRTALDEACRRAGFQPRVVSETNDYHAMLALVDAGVGVAVVPRIVAGFGRDMAVRLLPLTGTRLARRVGVADRAGGVRTPAMELMVGMLAESLGERLAATPFAVVREASASPAPA
jgi:DNA-binding transcriptional LysR family regulator